MNESITIVSGIDKDGMPECYEYIDLYIGEVISILGQTGSGKTALVTDIELLSQGDTITKRTILIDGQTPSDADRFNVLFKPITMITQNTKCFCDLDINEFLEIHAKARGMYNSDIINETIDLANRFTGEKIKGSNRVTELSGGQSRSLLFADAIKIGAAPIIILDEIENAGINKYEVIRNIDSLNKLVLFVTHDPVIALQTKKRLIMKNGAIFEIINRSPEEKKIFEELKKTDFMLKNIISDLRMGKTLTCTNFD